MRRDAPARLAAWDNWAGERFDRELWGKLAEAGLLGVGVPEEHGGMGFGFLEAGLLTLDPATEPETIVAIVRAATYCRFEVTDPAADEVVLMCILQLLVACVQCPSGGALSDEAVCEVVHSCYRISSQGSLSDLLRHQAEAGLRAMVRTLSGGVTPLNSAASRSKG
jgi:hypothetical protein